MVTEKNLRKHDSGKSYPADLSFVWANKGESIEVHLSNPKLLETRYLLAEMPWYKRLWVRLSINPYYFRFNADLKLQINRAGIKEVKQDKAIFESMILR